MLQKKILEFTVKFEADEEPGYTVTVPALPEVITEGRTLAEAEQMAQDAIRGALQIRREKEKSF